MPNTGGFSFSSVPRPRAPLSQFLLPLRPFFNCFRVTFVTCGKVDFIALQFAGEDYIWLLAAYRLPELPGHFLNITDVQTKFLSNLAVQYIGHQGKSGAGLSLCTTIDVLVISKDIRTMRDLTPAFRPVMVKGVLCLQCRRGDYRNSQRVRE